MFIWFPKISVFKGSREVVFKVLAYCLAFATFYLYRGGGKEGEETIIRLLSNAPNICDDCFKAKMRKQYQNHITK